MRGRFIDERECTCARSVPVSLRALKTQNAVEGAHGLTKLRWGQLRCGVQWVVAGEEKSLSYDPFLNRLITPIPPSPFASPILVDLLALKPILIPAHPHARPSSNQHSSPSSYQHSGHILVHKSVHSSSSTVQVLSFRMHMRLGKSMPSMPNLSPCRPKCRDSRPPASGVVQRQARAQSHPTSAVCGRTDNARARQARR